ncbi:ATP-dependent DNA helicase RecG [Fulvivirgaceae bacterium LMO-SS25]
MAGFFDTKIEYLKGVGPQKAALINKELSIFTCGDLIQHYPYRHEDRTKFYTISEINEHMPFVQIKGKIFAIGWQGEGKKKRLTAIFQDGTGRLELVWFKGQQAILRVVKPGAAYIVFGKPAKYGSNYSIAHPEMELLTENNQKQAYLQPVYSTTEKLKSRFLDSRALSKIIKDLLRVALPQIRETLPEYITEKYRLIEKARAIRHYHFPSSAEMLQKAKARLVFEELFYIQLRILKMKLGRLEKLKGQVFLDVSLLKNFYQDHLPFELTEAQKRVVREIHSDMKSGEQMNRLLQGDVGSGKTIVAFLSMLIAISNGTQACLMAPTEILANQHYIGLSEFADLIGVKIALLTGSVKGKNRRKIFDELQSGELHILVGTHAIIEEKVVFNKMGIAVIDEQHRFGVAQRARLWEKNKSTPPHILVMTATPIPRTLAMTLYGDLEVSVIDELPKGRKPIITSHRFDSHRLNVFGFIRQQINEGRQIYIVYPLIEESEKLDLKDLMDGFESVERAFPGVPVGILHGRMRPEDKDFEMDRFVRGETKIMVATTVIEVGVNVPNASVMVIENAERFGLAQLHQLRGRVGRGASQSYCILMSSVKLSKEAKVRLETMVRTNNGFEIAEKDLELRGPGDIQGTQQSGILDLLVADLSKDGKILQEARATAIEVLQNDPQLELPQHRGIFDQIERQKNSEVNWSRVS